MTTAFRPGLASRALLAAEARLLGIFARFNAVRRHPLNNAKREEYIRTHGLAGVAPSAPALEAPISLEFLRGRGSIEGTYRVVSVSAALNDTETASGECGSPERRAPADAILFRESGEWIGGGQLKFLNEGSQPVNAPVKALDRYVASLGNVTVIGGTRYVLLDEGRVAHDEEANYRHADVSIKYPNASRVDEDKIKIKYKPRLETSLASGIHLMGEGDGNYFHFLAEILPRLQLVDSLGRFEDLPLLITAGLHENLRAAIAILNDAGREIIELQPDVPYHVERLIYPSDTASILNIYGRLATREEGTMSVDWLRRTRLAVLAKVTNPAAVHRGRRLYVRRGKKVRALVNEPEIEEMMVDLGFETVAMEEMSFRVQVKLFADADMIVMPTGAAVANLMWCKPGCRVLILTSDHPAIQHNIWQLLCEACECELAFLRGPRANKIVGLHGVHDDFVVDAEALRSALQN